MASSSELIDCIREAGKIERVRRILDSPGTDVNQKCDRYRGNTALAYCHAYRWGHDDAYSTDVMKLMIDYGADVNAKNRYGNSVLIEFIKNYCSPDFISCLLSTGDVDVACRGSSGLTALHHCSNLRRDDGGKIIQMLLNCAGDGRRDLVNVLDDAGQTPMMRFVEARSPVENVMLVYDKRMDINLKDKNGNTALHLCPNADVLKFLLKKNPDLNALNNANLTPMMSILKREQDLEMIKLLVYEGAVIDHKVCFHSCYQYCKSIKFLNTVLKYMLLNKHANPVEVVLMHRVTMIYYKKGHKLLDTVINAYMDELITLKTTRLTEEGDLTLYDFCVEVNKKMLGLHFSRFHLSLDIFGEDKFPLFRDVIEHRLAVGQFWCGIRFKTSTLCLASKPGLPGVKSVTLNSHFIEQLIVPYLDDSDLLNLIEAAE